MATTIEIALMLGAAVLGIAALWHLYWAIGGTKGLGVAVPEKSASKGGGPVFVPSAFGTIAAGLLIAGLAAFYAFEARPLISSAVNRDTLFAPWEVALLVATGAGFILRAIGDFKYVGFFKRSTGTPFAIADSRYFSPLCLFLGVAGIAAAATRYL